MTNNKEYPDVVSVRIAISNANDAYTYKWFTSTRVASFERQNGTSSNDQPVDDSEELAEYCGVEIAEKHFGTRWPLIQNIIDVCVDSFRLESYNFRFGIDHRYHIDIVNSLKNLFEVLIESPNNTETIKEYMMVIATQLLRPDRKIRESLGLSEPQSIRELRASIKRELDNVQTDRLVLMRMFDIIEQAIDEYYQMCPE